jgi:hypothetical protein
VPPRTQDYNTSTITIAITSDAPCKLACRMINEMVKITIRITITIITISQQYHSNKE